MNLHAGSPERTPRLVTFGVLAIAAAWLGLRLGRGLPDIWNPDESYVVYNALKIDSGRLNPGWFGHPSLWLYVNAAAYAVVYAVGWILGFFGGPQDFASRMLDDPSLVLAVSRMLNVGACVGTVACAIRLGDALARPPAGVAAGLALLSMPAFFNSSRWAKFDAPVAFLAVLSLTILARRPTPAPRDRHLAAFVAGLALSTNYTAVFLPPVVVLVGAWTGADGLAARVRLGARLAGLAALGFFVASPFVLLDLPTFLNEFSRVSDKVAVDRTGQPVRPLLELVASPDRSLARDLGWPAVALLAFGLLRAVRGEVRARAIAGFAAGCLLLYFLVGVALVRYALPGVAPLLCLSVAEATKVAGRRFGKGAATATAALLGAALLVGNARVVLDSARGRLESPQRDPRVAARRWVESHVPSDSGVVVDAGFYESFNPRLRMNESRLRRMAEEFRAQWPERAEFYRMLRSRVRPPAYDLLLTRFGERLVGRRPSDFAREGYRYFVSDRVRWKGETPGSADPGHAAAPFYEALGAEAQLLARFDAPDGERGITVWSLAADAPASRPAGR